MVAPMAAFIGRKVENIRGKPTTDCAATGPDIVVPLPASCLAAVQLGGTRTFRTASATRGVEVTTVWAAHDSTVARALLSDPERKSLDADNVSLTLGPPSGYVIHFTNGLKVYLSGDTGLHAEMKSVVNEFHKVNLAMFNLGPSAVTSFSAAYAVNEFVKPVAVIATHVNEGATAGGKVKPTSRTAAFIDLLKGRPVYPALSGRTMEFDGNAKCVDGC
jgi:L-ascorbate metabolism protein UlaG (beta-lactamase superfamily)